MQIKTFSAETYKERRKILKSKIGSGRILFLGNGNSPMNYKDNYYHFRQDSCFLYYFGLSVAGLNAMIDIDKDETIIFGDELTMDDIVWTGSLPSVKEMAAQVGVDKTLASDQLKKYCNAELHYLPAYRHIHKIFLAETLGQSIKEIEAGVSSKLIKAIISQRNVKSREEIKQLDLASTITSQMHHYVMSCVEPGKFEYELEAKAFEYLKSQNTDFSFPCILTKNGETLHNHYHGNQINKGDLVLFDGGASSPLFYAGDMTRTFPASGKFTSKQADVYNIVLAAVTRTIDELKPGVKYMDSHLNAARTITDGLKALGLMKGDTDEAVAAGAHTLFFQHGLGHMIGLDVHDMENLGETLVGYEDGQERSPQFGTAFLRLARTLAPHHVITVEPGIYFIPALIDQWKAENKLSQFIDYSKLESYRDFGGIRIEDDVVITDHGCSVLGEPLAKTIGEVEAVIAKSA